ncbi:MAG: peptidylprolyl isomerase [Microscillaceae bacterium]|jgi:peptidyl-prolyl cis-trans isomerase SurA|nr:peptidylprolyl isomerase [Microscillaceae bacterium]
MKFLKNLIYSFWFLWLGIGIAQAQNPEVADKIIATVDNYIVLKSDLEAQFAQMLMESKGKIQDNLEERCKLLEQLIIQKMMLAKAEIDSVIVEEKQVQSQLDRRMEYMLGQIGGDEAKFMEYYGKTVNDMKEELRELIREQMTTQKMQEKITEDIKITPKEVRKFFNSIPSDSIPFFSAEVEVAHIVKIPEVTKEQKRITREKAESIRQRLENGESFAELAKTYSEDPGSGQRGGDLGWQKRGKFVPEFEAAIFRMKPGEISKPIESPYGFHIIQLVERRGNEFNSRHILIMPDLREVDLTSAERFLDSIRTAIVRDSITFAKAAKDFSSDKATSDNGGTITGPDGSSKLFIDQLDTYVYFVIDTMKVGQISRPVPYRTDDGKSGLRILYYKSKTEPHQMSIKEDYQKIHAYALNNKKNEAIELWFRRTKDQVYINIDPEYNQCNILKSQ